MVIAASPSLGIQRSDQSTIRIVEVVALEIPDSDAFKYKCRVVVKSANTVQIQKDLMTRLQPNWLVDVVHHGDCAIALTLLFREGGLGEPWQEAGTVEFETQGLFESERSVEVERAVNTWSLAPNLTLKTRLIQSQHSSQSDAVSLSLAATQARKRKRPPLSAEDKIPVELPEAIPLTMPEAVIVKDVWNKLRSWKELQMEIFYKRLLVEVPDLEYLFGEAIDGMPDYLYEMFDCCVRQLCPHTENVITEPLMGVPHSISSCPQFQPGKIQISVGVVQITTDAGKTRQGLCSNYLARATAGDPIRIETHTSDFRPPSDPSAPLLMVGPGTGVSPLIAFLQHREYLQNQGASLGDATLYFGCRNHSDFLYEEQLKAWLEQGILTDLQVAFSRLTDQKVYVQTLMQQNASALWQKLSHPQCHYYVCGDARMAGNVFDVFMAIAKSEGKLTHLEAVEFFDQMKKEKRFSTDVWGVTLNFKQAIKQVEKDNYARAEKWLASL